MDAFACVEESLSVTRAQDHKIKKHHKKSQKIAFPEDHRGQGQKPQTPAERSDGCHADVGQKRLIDKFTAEQRAGRDIHLKVGDDFGQAHAKVVNGLPKLFDGQAGQRVGAASDDKDAEREQR